MRTIQFSGKRKDGPEILIGDLNHINGETFIFPRDEKIIGEQSANSPDWYEIEPHSVTIKSNGLTSECSSKDLKEQTVKEGRESMAVFMGAIQLDKENLAGDAMWRFPYPVPAEINMVRQNEFETGRINFDSRIEMLYPVWLKFRDLEITGEDSIFEHNGLCVDIIEYLMNGNCALGFLNIYKGIRWYNLYLQTNEIEGNN